MMTTYVRNGKLFVETLDGRTVDIMRREEERNKENKEPKRMAKLYTIMNYNERISVNSILLINFSKIQFTPIMS